MVQKKERRIFCENRKENWKVRLVKCATEPARLFWIFKETTRSEIELNFLTAWTISMENCKRVYHFLGYQILPQMLLIFAQWHSYGLSKLKNQAKMITKLWKIITKSSGKN